MGERTKCKIKRLIPGDPEPIISVTFDSGSKKNEIQDIDCHVLSKGGNPQDLVALVSRKDQVYYGTPQDPSETYCHTLLLVVNSNGKGTLVPTVPCRLTNSANHVFKKPKLDNTLSSSFDESKFGSKKYQRTANIRKKLQDTKAESSAALEKSLLDVQECDLDVLTKGEDVARENLVTAMLPPCNRDATDVAFVYKTSGLLSNSDLANLEDYATLLLNPPDDPKKDSDFLVYPFYASVSNKTLLKMQLLLYANILLRFFSVNRKTLQKKHTSEIIEQFCPYSCSVGKKVLETFTTSSNNARSKSDAMNDKVLCHAIVAILLACDYQLQVDWFSGCIQATKKHLLNLVRVVGLHKASNGYHVLKLPLPPLPSGKKRKNKG